MRIAQQQTGYEVRMLNLNDLSLDQIEIDAEFPSKQMRCEACGNVGGFIVIIVQALNAAFDV
jgi:hypothetical protein